MLGLAEMTVGREKEGMCLQKIAFLLKKLLFIARKYTGKMEASDPYAIVRDPLGVAPRTMQVSIVNARETSPLDQLLQAR